MVVVAFTNGLLKDEASATQGNQVQPLTFDVHLVIFHIFCGFARCRLLTYFSAFGNSFLTFLFYYYIEINFVGF